MVRFGFKQYVFFLFLSVVAADSARALSEQSAIPKDELTLIVSSTDAGHLHQQLDKLATLSERKQLRVRAAFIAGFSGGSLGVSNKENRALLHPSRSVLYFEDLAKSALGKSYDLLEKAGIGYFEFQTHNELIERLKLQYSPTWVIRHRGKLYVYEGHPYPERLFDRSGNFNSGNFNAAGSSVATASDIAYHDRKRSSIRLSASGSNNMYGLQFRQPYWKAQENEHPTLVSYQELPTCTDSKVRRERVFQHTPGTDAFDVAYFNPEAPKQKRAAQQHQGRTVAYQAALQRDPISNSLPRWQVFARFIRISCLPTRFRFHYIDGQRYIEYREGESAWEEY